VTDLCQGREEGGSGILAAPKTLRKPHDVPAPYLALGALLLPVAAFANDPYSYAQPDEVRVSHLDLQLKLDFAQRQLDGQATLTLDWKDPKATNLVLDTRDLNISSVESVDAAGKTTALKYTLAPRDKQLGSKLTIQTPQRPHEVRIVYTTSPAASGLQWLPPAQTADKKQPFMFSQSESIHARSWVPLQDSPAIRFTYNAHVAAPQDTRVAMSAPNDPKHPLNGDFSFSQTHPIPSYLLAIAAGDLDVRETGPRSAVYAEPSVVGKAAHEFEDTEKMIEPPRSFTARIAGAVTTFSCCRRVSRTAAWKIPT
jgi:leukotriene-A4 hydrolase